MREITNPPSPSQVLVWRYINTDKFVRLLKESVLDLTQACCFEDQCEGLPTFAEVKRMQIDAPFQNKAVVSPIDIITACQNRAYISAWHKNNYESYAMWKLYAGGNDGVAIQTTYEALSECDGGVENSGCVIGEVQYIDFYAQGETQEAKRLTHIDLLLRKDLSFQYENEVRIIKIVNEPKGQLHISLDIKLQNLIKKIYVNPYAPDWYYKSIEFLIGEYTPSPLKQLLLQRLQPRKTHLLSRYMGEAREKSLA